MSDCSSAEESLFRDCEKRPTKSTETGRKKRLNSSPKSETSGKSKKRIINMITKNDLDELYKKINMDMTDQLKKLKEEWSTNVGTRLQEVENCNATLSAQVTNIHRQLRAKNAVVIGIAEGEHESENIFFN